MINNVTLVGRITKDVELRKTQSGVSVASFTLAVNRTFNKEEQEADFIMVTAWRHSADFLAKYVHKGDLLGVTGRIETRNYEDKNGQRVYVTEIQADSVQQLESRKEKEKRRGGSISHGGYQPEYEPRMQQDDRTQEIGEGFGGPTLDISSDDLPF